jgi:hypothetical protein
MSSLYTRNGRPLQVSGSNLYSRSGTYVGRISGSKVYDPSGRYAGTIVGDRVVYRSTDSAFISGPQRERLSCWVGCRLCRRFGHLGRRAQLSGLIPPISGTR